MKKKEVTICFVYLVIGFCSYYLFEEIKRQKELACLESDTKDVITFHFEVKDYERKPDKKCKLNNGDIVSYYCCGKTENEYDPKLFYCIGKGTIYEINGVEQNSEEQLYFYVKVESPPKIIEQFPVWNPEDDLLDLESLKELKLTT